MSLRRFQKELPLFNALTPRLADAAAQASKRGFAVVSAASLPQMSSSTISSSQTISDSESDVTPVHPGCLESLMSTLGPLMFTPGEVSHPDHDYVFVVSNVGRKQPPRSVFHSDTSYVERPPSYTLLAGVKIPEHGGETRFVDQYAAYDSLRGSLRQALCNVEFLHCASRVPNASAAGKGAWHPVLRRHPSTGRTALFVSARERLVGARRDGQALDDGEADELIAAVHDHATSGAAEHRHRWRAGDLLLTDNRCTLHAADHSSVQGDRVLHRVMVQGERPMAASH